jgi:hypothetical protein
MNPIIPRGCVRKLVVDPAPVTLYLKHVPSLFAEDEWEWTEDRDEAFIFPTFDQAEQARELLKANGEKLVFAAVHEETREYRAEPEEVIHPLPSSKCAPEDVYAELEKRNLA